MPPWSPLEIVCMMSDDDDDDDDDVKCYEWH